ncbi:MAG: hypothetical protein IJ068_00410 [Bacilli bacterium]|nr:hypothetical protein [Bacilli bacterium]
MFAIDITRNEEDVISDMIIGKDSMDAKRKIMNYITEYCFANYGLFFKEDILDQYLDINSFSLKKFLNVIYSITIDKDLLIQSIATDKDNCLFVKSYTPDKQEFPSLHTFNKNDLSTARSLINFLINDALILEYRDDLSSYEKLKNELKDKNINQFFHKNMKFEIVSLYKNGLFLEELITNSLSLRQLEGEDFGGIEI